MIPFVSIIVPIYNVEKYLPKCMDTLLNQTLRNIEIIMVDDGSPDGCPVLCDEYAKKDVRIKVVHKQNSGLGYARNSGLEVATGEYVAFVDSDDYVDVSMYEKLYTKACENHAEAVFCGLQRVWEDGRIMSKSDVKEETLFTGDAVKELALDFIAPVPGYSVERKYEMSVWHSVYKRSVLSNNKIKFYSERNILSEDLPFQVDFFLNAKRIYFIPDVLYFYRMDNGGSLTKTFSVRKFYCSKNLFLLMCDKTSIVDNQSLRAQRLFIAYTRSMCKQIASSKVAYAEKISMYREITSDAIWKKTGEYKYQYLPMYARIFLFLQRNRMNYALLGYSYLIGLISK